MRGLLICFVALLGVTLFSPDISAQNAPPATPGTGSTSSGAPAAGQQSSPGKDATGKGDKPLTPKNADPQPPATPGCTDPISTEAVKNANVSITADPATAWQPRGGTVSFTVNANNAKLDGVNVIVCFGWPERDWTKTQFKLQGRLSLVKFEPNSATYNVVVPALESAPHALKYRTALRTVPLAMMRIIAYGGPAASPVDVQTFVGITSPRLALSGALVAVAIALLVFYFFGRARGVPGRGLLLWMISTRNGYASLSQAQIMLWTFLIGASAIYVMALSGVLIDISGGTLMLLGITGAATIGSKLQNNQQDAKGTNGSDGKTALPGPVIGLDQAGAATESEVRLVWAPPITGGVVMGYLVEYQQSPPAGGPANPVWNAVSEILDLPHHTVLGLAPATSYQFRVRAVNAGGQGDALTIGPISTLPAQIFPAGAPPAAGGLGIVGALTQTQINLGWSPAAAGSFTYLVQYRRHDSTDMWQTWATVNQLSCNVRRLRSGVTYDFRVAALNAAGQQGPWSVVVSGRTLRNPQWADLVVTGDGRGEIDVTRAQMLFFTVVAALFVGMKVLTSFVIPEIPQGIVLLMGISNGVYITAKYISD